MFGSKVKLKYKLRKDLKLDLGYVTLFRVEYIATGHLGGYIESEKNLSQEGNAQVFCDAQVYGDARVYGNAQVSNNAQVFCDAQVYGDAQVSDNARVFGNARVSGNAQVFGNARVENINEIINIVVAFKFSITVTPDNIVIGCQLKSRSEWIKITSQDAEKRGLPPDMYPHYKKMVSAAMKLVPKRKKEIK